MRPVIAAAVVCKKSLRVAMRWAPLLNRTVGFAAGRPLTWRRWRPARFFARTHLASTRRHDSNIAEIPEGTLDAIAAKGRANDARRAQPGARRRRASSDPCAGPASERRW